MNVILGTAFSITLGIWRLRVRVAIEDTAYGEGDLFDDKAVRVR
jgi:hypothetical protein